jgi:hypothetical protein
MRQQSRRLAAHAKPAAWLALVLLVLCINTASGRSSPKIWDVKPGTPVGDLPGEEFVDPACGANGGPPGLRIASFEQFKRCSPEASGLREIWFRYDDEEEYIARAARDPDAIARANAMLMLGQPVVLSLLVDRAGLVQGYRIITDPRAGPDVREGAYLLARAFKAHFGADGWDCDDMPPSTGETAIDGEFVKQRCRKVVDGQQVRLESRHYYKPGQTQIDPNSGVRTANQFESATRFEIVSLDSIRK